VPDPVLTVRAVTELISVVAPMLRELGRNEEADQLERRKAELLDDSDARLDRVIDDRSQP
jgi:hypothetical protein